MQECLTIPREHTSKLYPWVFAGHRRSGLPRDDTGQRATYVPPRPYCSHGALSPCPLPFAGVAAPFTPTCPDSQSGFLIGAARRESFRGGRTSRSRSVAKTRPCRAWVAKPRRRRPDCSRETLSRSVLAPPAAVSACNLLRTRPTPPLLAFLGRVSSVFPLGYLATGCSATGLSPSTRRQTEATQR
jgi:hypothetical protein